MKKLFLGHYSKLRNVICDIVLYKWLVFLFILVFRRLSGEAETFSLLDFFIPLCTCGLHSQPLYAEQHEGHLEVVCWYYTLVCCGRNKQYSSFCTHELTGGLQWWHSGKTRQHSCILDKYLVSWLTLKLWKPFFIHFCEISCFWTWVIF